MEFTKEQSIIEAMLFASGKEINIKDFMNVLELSAEDIDKIILNIKTEYEARNSGLEIIKVNDNYQMCTKKEYYEYIYPLFDNRAKPNISNAALETLSIIAYNPNITRAQIEAIRGVNSDGTIYKLLEFDLIEEAGKLDAPGRPTMYKVTNNFMKMFGISSLDELPDLPRYKLDENEQIVIDDVLENPKLNENDNEQLEQNESDNNEELKQNENSNGEKANIKEEKKKENKKD